MTGRSIRTTSDHQHDIVQGSPTKMTCHVQSQGAMALQVVLSLLLHLLDAEIHRNEVLDIPSLQGITVKSLAHAQHRPLSSVPRSHVTPSYARCRIRSRAAHTSCSRPEWNIGMLHDLTEPATNRLPLENLHAINLNLLPGHVQMNMQLRQVTGVHIRIMRIVRGLHLLRLQRISSHCRLDPTI